MRCGLHGPRFSLSSSRGLKALELEVAGPSRTFVEGLERRLSERISKGSVRPHWLRADVSRLLAVVVTVALPIGGLFLADALGLATASNNETEPWETAFLAVGLILGLCVFFGESYYYPPFEITDERGTRLRRHWGGSPPRWGWSCWA